MSIGKADASADILTWILNRRVAVNFVLSIELQKEADSKRIVPPTRFSIIARRYMCREIQR